MHKNYRLRPGIIGTVIFIFFLPVLCVAQFRVIGYVPVMHGALPAVGDSALKKLTHLNVAFINPDSSGNLLLPEGFDSLLSQAKANKVKLLISIGGGTFNPYYAVYLKKDQRKAFVDKLVALAVDHAADGIDVDLEGDAIDNNYDGLIADLYAALKPKGKLLTAALATWNAQLISTAALKKFDFINIMSYDQTGPWRPMEPGPHSTYAKAEEDLHYWTNTRGFPKKKVNLGLPFYGYGFGTSYGESMSFGAIVSTFPNATQEDMVVPGNGGIIYYNGLATIQSKTAIALKNAGGVMIWHILQDAEGENSLLNAIDSIIKNSK